MRRGAGSRHARGTRAVAWLAIALAGALAMLLRYRLVEVPALAARCAGSADAGGVLCTLRTLVVQGFLHQAYGVAALLAAALALRWPRPAPAALAAALGAFACGLYGVPTGALALLIGTVLLERGAAWSEHGQREQPVQRQP